MKERLLHLLACPKCGGQFKLNVVKTEGGEVSEGTLFCPSGHQFSITDSIPRLVDNVTEKLKQKTAKSFGFEWNVFNKMFTAYRANFLNYIDPIKEEFFKNKIVFDAGCGVGRHTYWAAKFGAREVIGIDFSNAVNASYENTKHLPNVHIIQADIYQLPFKKEIFDYAFSIGVLHHLPNPERGFRAIIPFIKSGGTYSIWVYGRKNNFSNVYVYETIRKITRHLPHKLLCYLCLLPALGVELMNRLCKMFQFKFLPFQYYVQFPFKVKWNDAFDVFATPKSTYWLKEQIEAWYHQAQFRRFEVSHLRRKSLKAYGIKPNSEANNTSPNY